MRKMETMKIGCIQITNKIPTSVVLSSVICEPKPETV